MPRAAFVCRRKQREENRRMKAFAPVPSKYVVVYYVPLLLVTRHPPNPPSVPHGEGDPISNAMIAVLAGERVGLS